MFIPISKIGEAENDGKSSRMNQNGEVLKEINGTEQNGWALMGLKMGGGCLEQKQENLLKVLRKMEEIWEK